MVSPATDTHTTSTQLGHDGGHEKVFPPFDSSTFASQLLWLAITFGALYYLMSKVALPRIGSILETRRDRIESDLAQAENYRRETDEAIAAYEQARAQARARAQGIAQETRDKLRVETDARRDEIEASLNEKLLAADTQIREITKAAMGEIDDIATDVAQAVIGKLSSQEVSRATVAKAVKRALG